MDLVVEGFDWDEENREKCRRHGVSIEEIEAVLRAQPRAHRIPLTPRTKIDTSPLEEIGTEGRSSSHSRSETETIVD